jgi:hypothetical protein
MFYSPLLIFMIILSVLELSQENSYLLPDFIYIDSQAVTSHHAVQLQPPQWALSPL